MGWVPVAEQVISGLSPWFTVCRGGSRVTFGGAEKRNRSVQEMVLQNQCLLTDESDDFLNFIDYGSPVVHYLTQVGSFIILIHVNQVEDSLLLVVSGWEPSPVRSSPLSGQPGSVPHTQAVQSQVGAGSDRCVVGK